MTKLWPALLALVAAACTKAEAVPIPPSLSEPPEILMRPATCPSPPTPGVHLVVELARTRKECADDIARFNGLQEWARKVTARK